MSINATFRVSILLGILVVILGEIISFYTEFVILVKPCLICYILRYTYLSLGIIQVLSIFRGKYIIIAILLSISIVIVSIYGLLGYKSYVVNPCIEICPYSEDILMSSRLLSLSAVGGALETLLMLQALRSAQEK